MGLYEEYLSLRHQRDVKKKVRATLEKVVDRLKEDRDSFAFESRKIEHLLDGAKTKGNRCKRVYEGQISKFVFEANAALSSSGALQHPIDDMENAKPAYSFFTMLENQMTALKQKARELGEDISSWF